ncbi:hypothetical protein VHEMI06613 [[Torrubiella] hemipterigena]|uniref:Ecp2 effector protein domain-containing protein n=1 Tax=[Torrubiella] hemipterigena TaxID=1531966 RepID=A0A0A1T7T0_9HYPO|nr:hypothetical protein VHEMI06613 [[Torrubiella] hemipterigena]
MLTGSSLLWLSGFAAAVPAHGGSRHTYAATPKRSTDIAWSGITKDVENPKTVEARWTVPHCSRHKTDPDNRPEGIAAWIGIDEALLQAGTTCQGYTGKEEYFARIEFIPYPPDYLKLDVKPGDDIFARLTATSNFTGTVYIGNRTTGKNVTATAKGKMGIELCFKTVEWIAEEPGGTSGVWMENIKMTECNAVDAKGGKTNLAGGEIIDRVTEDGKMQ